MTPHREAHHNSHSLSLFVFGRLRRADNKDVASQAQPQRESAYFRQSQYFYRSSPPHKQPDHQQAGQYGAGASEDHGCVDGLWRSSSPRSCGATV